MGLQTEMKNFRRTYVLTALALCALLIGAASAQAISNKSAAKKGASWISKSRLSNFPGTGFEADTVSALVAAGRSSNSSAVKRFVDSIQDDTTDYAQGAGPTGKLILAVVAARKDPRCFGPGGQLSNLVAILNSDYNSSTGRFGGDKGTVYDQALAILALKAAHETIPSKAVKFARNARGKYGWNFALSRSAGDEVESTAIMIEALRAAGVSKKDGGLKSAYKWITYQRNNQGGYNPAGQASDPFLETQADTTAYAIRAGSAMGISGGLMKKAKTALRALQQKNGLIRTTPSVRGDYPGISTANGTLALSGHHYPVVVRKKRSTCAKV